MQITVKIKGLSCSHCVEAIELMCKSLPCVEKVQYLADSKSVLITGMLNMRTDWLKLAIEEAGYHIEEQQILSTVDGGY